MKYFLVLQDGKTRVDVVDFNIQEGRTHYQEVRSLGSPSSELVPVRKDPDLFVGRVQGPFPVDIGNPAPVLFYAERSDGTSRQLGTIQVTNWEGRSSRSAGIVQQFSGFFTKAR